MAGQRGRPRSAHAHQSILDATRDLLAEGGYEGLTIEAIAARAGVGKQTVYRWWPAKASIVAELVTAGVIDNAPGLVDDTGDITEDLRSWSRGMVASLRDAPAASLARALTAAAAEQQTDAERLYEQSVAPFRNALVSRLERAASVGQLRDDADLETVADAMMGTALYLIITRNTPDDSYAEALVDLLLTGVRATTPSLSCPTREALDPAASD